MNHCVFFGTVGRDAKVNDSRTAANFSLAINESYRDKKTNEYKKVTTWIDVTVFGNLINMAERYLKKGQRILVSAKASNSEYTDRNGAHVSKTTFIAEKIEFVESMRAKQEREEKQNEGFMSIPDEIEAEGALFT